VAITPNTLTRAAGVAAVAAGVIFIGVQIGHPHLDADSITTTEVTIRGSLKVLMTALALVGITGMYLNQVRRNGVLGLVGYPYRLLALPNGIALIVLGYSLWRTTRAAPTGHTAPAVTGEHVTKAVAA